MIISRRKFLAGLVAAPAIVHAANIMRIQPLVTPSWVHDELFPAENPPQFVPGDIIWAEPLADRTRAFMFHVRNHATDMRDIMGHYSKLPGLTFNGNFHPLTHKITKVGYDDLMEGAGA